MTPEQLAEYAAFDIFGPEGLVANPRASTIIRQAIYTALEPQVAEIERLKALSDGYLEDFVESQKCVKQLQDKLALQASESKRLNTTLETLNKDRVKAWKQLRLTKP